MAEHIPNEYIEFRRNDNGGIIPIDTRNGNAIGEAGEAIRLEHKQRIAKWTSPEVIASAIGLSRQQIYEKYGNTPEPIACIHKKYLKYFSEHTEDTTIYCGMGYFVDHIVNHHPQLPFDVYDNIQDILNNPDTVIRDDRMDNMKKKRDNLIFIKKYDRNLAVAISLTHTNDKIILHKSLYETKKNPYSRLPRIGMSEDASPSISRTVNTVPGGRRLSARDKVNILILLDKVNPYEPITDTQYESVFSGLNRIRH